MTAISLVAKFVSGAVGRTRTGDLLITNQLLYQLSYNGLLAGIPETTRCAILFGYTPRRRP